MRGAFRAFCIAAGSLALLPTHARASDPGPASVSFRFTGPSVSRTADSYLAGESFAWKLAGPSGAASITGVVDPVFGPVEPNGPPRPDRFNLQDVVAQLPLSSDLALNFGYRLDSVRAPDAFDLSAGFDGLFLSSSALGGDLGSFGNTNYVGATLKLSDNVALHAGEASSSVDRNSPNVNAFSTLSRPVDALLDFGARTANTLMAGVTFKASDWGGFDLSASRGVEKNSLGQVPFPALATDAFNVSADVKFGSWVTTASYGESLTKLDIKPSALALSSAGELRQTGYALSIAKHGVFGDDALGLSVSRPIDPEAVSGGFVTVAQPANQPVFIGPDHLLADQKPETDIELGYTTSFNDSFALQTNAAYEMNFQGKNGINAVQLLSRAKIKF
jgi:hypothetical protein